MMQIKKISDNEIYLLIKYIKSVLWRAAKRLSYTEDARCLKVNGLYSNPVQTEMPHHKSFAQMWFVNGRTTCPPSPSPACA